MKKSLCFAANSAIVARTVCDSIHTVLGNYLDVIPWSVDKDWQTPPRCNLYLASQENVLSAARAALPEGAELMLAERFINPSAFDRLLYLPAGTSALIAAGTRGRALSIAEAVKSAGITHLELKPHYPGCDAEANRHITTVIAAGLNNYIPDWAETTVDLGPQGIALSTYIAVINYFDIPIHVINSIIMAHTNAIFRLTHKYYSMERKTEALLQGIDDIVISMNAEGTIDTYNSRASDFFGPRKLRGLDIEELFPGIRNTIEQGGNIEGIFKYNDADLLVKSSLINDVSRQDAGIIVTARPTSLVHEMEHTVRRTMYAKGHTGKYTFRDILGASPALVQVVQLAKRYAATDLSILLEGETGVGKEVFAQSIHASSARRKGPFVALNFAALPESLAESELFGYEAGAFTGASKKGQPGLFELAHDGTIFLDEIGDASPEMQTRLLRVLQEHEVRRIGGRGVIPVDVRVIAATNRNLALLVKEGTFRSDLYYRLCACPLYIPPLRERASDIFLLADQFAGKRFGRVLPLSPEVAAFFSGYNWPGNVRELQNVISFIYYGYKEADAITLRMLPPYLLRDGAPSPGFDGAERREGAADATDAFVRMLADKKVTAECRSLLAELEYRNTFGLSTGYAPLLARIRETHHDCSGYLLRLLLRLLKAEEYILSGKTKQGTRISAKGKQLLQRLNAA